MQGNEKWDKMPFLEQGVIGLDSLWWAGDVLAT